ncbi:MAG: cell division topological specificity factor MinE [Chloroflexi bacterium]|nr:cell division topological specificity factor MinE [Chloroflexota bacterium]
MSNFLGRLFGRSKEESSAQAAKRRLQFVLVHDRINLPPDLMTAMKEEILQVISKYVQVAGESIDIALKPSEGGHQPAHRRSAVRKDSEHPAWGAGRQRRRRSRRVRRCASAGLQGCYLRRRRPIMPPSVRMFG